MTFYFWMKYLLCKFLKMLLKCSFVFHLPFFLLFFSCSCQRCAGLLVIAAAVPASLREGTKVLSMCIGWERACLLMALTTQRKGRKLAFVLVTLGMLTQVFPSLLISFPKDKPSALLKGWAVPVKLTPTTLRAK